MPFDPRMLSFERWSSLTAPLLATFGWVPVTANEDDWKSWARAVKALPAFGAVAVPGPGLYDDWHLWAFRLNEVLLRLGL